jgi:hypothetical protein
MEVNNNNYQNEISYFDNILSKSSKNISIETLFDRIKSDAELALEINTLREEKDKKARDLLKKKLPAVTFSGVFENGHKAEGLLAYSNFICLDIDNIDNLNFKKDIIAKDKYTYSVFISPSGNGLKVIIKVDGGKTNHFSNFTQLQEYYKQNLHIEIDISGKDISRLAFLSHDPKIYINDQSETWSNDKFTKFKFKSLVEELGKTFEFKESQRNIFILKLSTLCKEANLNQNEVVNLSVEEFSSNDFDNNEISNTINSAYKNNYKSPNLKKTEGDKGLSNWNRAELYLSENFDLRYNIVSNKCEYKRKNSDDLFEELNENTVFRDLKKNDVSFSMANLSSLLSSDFVVKFNPFVDYFDSILKIEEESKFDHIVYLTSFVKTSDQPWFETQFKKMLVRSIACSINDKVFNKQVFVLVHSVQNSGKSTFCRFLCPPNLANYFTENIGVDKDSQIALTTNILVNMDELAMYNKSEINTLKSLISKDKISVRMPYGKRQVSMPRRANFVGSTNKGEFLTDETGSVRWLCFELEDNINFKYRELVDIDLVWKQAYQLYLDGFDYELTKEEILINETKNKSYLVLTFEYQLLEKHIKALDKANGGSFYTATDIKLELDKLYPHQSIKPESIGKALKALGIIQTNEYLPEKLYSVKGYYLKIQ